MQELRVWAPNRKTVTLDLSGRRIPMKTGPRGWWSVEAPDGQLDYAFVLDGGPPLPDPRSPWQPSGVHGPSRTLDHAAFLWTDREWQAPPLSSAVFYELHVGTFTPRGTFDSAIQRIPYLKELGVTHVELMPVTEFPGEWGWGYDGVDLYAPHHSYGGPEGLKCLVDALHANGLAAVLDVVYNHLGPCGNYLGQYGPYFTGCAKTPWGDAINLMGRASDEVRDFLIANALMWLRDYHFDGLRLDAVHALVDTSALHFLEALAGAVKHLEALLGRPLSVIAESDLNDPRLIRPETEGGYGLAAQWSDDFHHALHTVLTGESTGYYCDFGALGHIAKAFERGYVYDGQYSEFRARSHGRALPPALKRKLLVCLQNHDQVGNRARGDRIHMLTTLERVKIGAALVLLGPSIPLLFQGEEWAASAPFQYFTNHTDPELGRAVSVGRRREFAAFGWAPEQVPDPQDPETFRRSKLDWSEIDRSPHGELLSWYRQLIAFRKARPELTSPEAVASFNECDGVLSVQRPGISVVCNLGNMAFSLPPKSGAALLLSSSPRNAAAAEIVLPPGSVSVYSGQIHAQALQPVPKNERVEAAS
jgi:maltooligosyltrehalose trehalohydrolase